MKVEQHRLAVAGQQHVGRFQIQVQQAALVSVVQGVGQAGADPADGMFVRLAGQQLQRRAFERQRRRRLTLQLHQGFRQPPAAALFGGAIVERRQHRIQTGAAEIRHAERPQAAFGKILHEIQRDNAGVLQARQREVLGDFQRGQLDHDRPIRKRWLRGQEYAAGRPAAQFAEQAKLAELFADLGKFKRGPVLKQSVAGQQQFQLRLQVRKTCEQLSGIDRFARFLAEPDLFADQPHGLGGFQRGGGLFGQELFDGQALPLAPLNAELASQLRTAIGAMGGFGREGSLGRRAFRRR